MSRRFSLLLLMMFLVAFLGISAVFAGEPVEVAQVSTPIVITPVIVPIGSAVISIPSANQILPVNPTLPFIPSPTQFLSALPSSTVSPFNRRAVDAEGYWFRFESIELQQYLGSWQLVNPVSNASDGGYHRSLDLGAIMRFTFTGTGIRLGYRVSAAGGDMHVLLDGQALAVFSTLSTSGDERSIISDPLYFSINAHVIDIVANGLSGQRFEIDFLDVYVGPDRSTVSPMVSAADATPDENQRVPLIAFDLVTLPQQIPTLTPLSEVLVSVSVVAFYDSNANQAVDANEGIENLSLRVLDSVSNRVLASSLTDRSGSARIQLIASRDVLLVVPLLGRSEEISVSSSRTGMIEEQWLIEVEPINIPALIP